MFDVLMASWLCPKRLSLEINTKVFMVDMISKMCSKIIQGKGGSEERSNCNKNGHVLLKLRVDTWEFISSSFLHI